MCRGNNKQNLFFTDVDKEYYRSLLRKHKYENKILINHYCLMNNHVHLIVWLKAHSRLSRFMKQVNLSYFKFYNKKYGYCGHLWQDRFKSNIIDSDIYLLHCGKYIELNPVRARLVNSPGEYEFSSYNFYAKTRCDDIVTLNPALFEFSVSEEIRRKYYIEFTVDYDSINRKNLNSLTFIGSKEFIESKEKTFGVMNAPRRRGRPKK